MFCSELFNFIFIYYCITFANSAVFKIQPINKSTYLVTSFPELDYPIAKENNFLNTGSVYDRLRIPNPTKISAEFIAKARENYFRTFTPLNKTMTPYLNNDYLSKNTPKYKNAKYSTNLKNILTARRLTSALINELQLSSSLKQRKTESKKRGR